MRRLKSFLSNLARILLIVILIAFFLLPLLWLFTAPFSRAATLRISLPTKPTLNNFRVVLSNPISFRALFVNSPIIAGGAMIGVTLIASLAAYALSRIKVPGQSLIVYILILFSAVVTGTAAMVPIFLLLYSLKLIDTHLGTILVYIGGLLPTGIFLMRGFVDSVPRSYEEAAIVSGAKPLQMFRDVVIPIIRPGMMVVAVWAFVQSWGDFLIPMVLIRSPLKMPAPIAIYTFYTEGGTPVLTLVSAYSLIYMLPAIVLYLFVNWKYGFRFFGGIKR
ncbi:carbohydrate ABC transporter permease [Pseudothermotoga thermarum]|uniref:Carbohydrate ABC transporter membrane protein 2, CUT1 family n=1 Tax=Pseudothermotoga thermarum DSM 5069 TaxID=688269 RepID=F7YUX0_9THEM|nr:carbohydrate ABC transporter permease [Pseudothermotoga thermarum]AEH51531.1 carbohydrate ABC transporter membrane protein 2, CUT1 family [Pseudothermotoga thermarum DSM 5069]